MSTWVLPSSILSPGARDDATVVMGGDSLTDGRGTTTNANNRWTDQLRRPARRG